MTRDRSDVHNYVTKLEIENRLLKKKIEQLVGMIKALADIVKEEE